MLPKCGQQESNYLDPLQAAFHSAHSTEAVILSVLDNLHIEGDIVHFSALVLLDLSAAFDTVDHNIF